MSTDTPSPGTPAGSPQGLTTTQWLIVIVASIGFAFDIYELLMLPLIAGPALEELANVQKGTPEYGQYVGMLFYIPAVMGGIFGLLGGYLTDRLGRRFVLVWSIILYAVSAFLAGFSTSFEMLLILRCTTFIGVCVEFVAAIAWLAELFPDPKRREIVLGYTQAFSSLGGLMVAGVFILLNIEEFRSMLPEIHLPVWLSDQIGEVTGSNAAWRYTLMSGLIPAIPLLIIRPFLPESPAWKKKRAEGSLKRPSIRELFQPELRQTTIITTLMFVCSYGAAFGAIQHVPRMLPGLPTVQNDVKEAVAQLKSEHENPTEEQLRETRQGAVGRTAGTVQTVQEVGGLVGRFLLAFLVIRIVSRRKLMRVFQIPGLIIIPVVFAYAAVSDLSLLYIGIFLAGLFTVAQFSFWGNYLPRMYPVHLRGTGESFAANVGGRMIGTCAAWVTVTVANNPAWFPELPDPTRLAYSAALMSLFVYALGSILCFWLPEPKEEELPE